MEHKLWNGELRPHWLEPGAEAYPVLECAVDVCVELELAPSAAPVGPPAAPALPAVDVGSPLPAAPVLPEG